MLAPSESLHLVALLPKGLVSEQPHDYPSGLRFCRPFFFFGARQEATFCSYKLRSKAGGCRDSAARVHVISSQDCLASLSLLFERADVKEPEERFLLCLPSSASDPAALYLKARALARGSKQGRGARAWPREVPCQTTARYGDALGGPAASHAALRARAPAEVS